MGKNDLIHDLREQLAVLNRVKDEYGGRTIENIIQQIESRIKHYQK